MFLKPPEDLKEQGLGWSLGMTLRTRQAWTMKGTGAPETTLEALPSGFGATGPPTTPCTPGGGKGRGSTLQSDG